MNARRRHLPDAMLACLVALLLIASTARAQEGPIVIGEREEIPRFHMEPIDVALELRAYYSADRIRSSDGSRRFRQYRFDEVLTLATSGHVVHPNFADYRLSLGLGLSQIRASGDGRTSRENEFLTEFDSSVTFLREQTVPLTLYARRHRTIINRPFGPSLENVLTSYGARTAIALDRSSHILDLSTSRSTQDGFTGRTDFQLDQDRFLWTSTYRPDNRQAWTWDYQFTRTEQRRPGFQTEFDTHDLRLNHELNFGSREQHRLSSTVRYLQRSGDLSLRSFRWDEHLRLRHTDNFETRYRYSYGDRTVRGIGQTHHRATAGFRHRLYESLITTGTIGLQETRTNASRTFETFGNLDFDYRKRVPYGLFTSRLALGYSRLDSESRAAPTPVVDENRVFTNAVPIVLIGPEVMAETIVVKDPTGQIIYTPGIDYFVTPFADRVEVHRVVGGRLDAGDAVLLDYFLAPRPRHVRHTNSFALSGRYDIQEGPLEGVGFFSRFARQDQRIDTAAPGLFIPHDFTDLTVGADYRTGNLTLSAERQWRDSRIFPFEATRFSARYRRPVGIDTSLILSSNYSIIDYTASPSPSTPGEGGAGGYRVNLFTASAQVQHRFNARLRGVGTLAWRDERNERFGRTTGFEQQVELRWDYRQTDLFVSLRNADLHRGDTRQNFQFLFVGLRREF